MYCLNLCGHLSFPALFSNFPAHRSSGFLLMLPSVFVFFLIFFLLVISCAHKEIDVIFVDLIEIPSIFLVILVILVFSRRRVQSRRDMPSKHTNRTHQMDCAAARNPLAPLPSEKKKSTADRKAIQCARARVTLGAHRTRHDKQRETINIIQIYPASVSIKISLPALFSCF